MKKENTNILSETIRSIAQQKIVCFGLNILNKNDFELGHAQHKFQLMVSTLFLMSDREHT